MSATSKEQRQLILELERRREQAKKEIRMLLSKQANKLTQNQGYLQLQVLQKDLQAFYKDLLQTKEIHILEKQINDMIYNIQDCL